jgi:hypothetical protein
MFTLVFLPLLVPLTNQRASLSLFPQTYTPTSRQLRNPSRMYQHVRLPRFAAHSPPSHTGSPRSTRYTRRDSPRSRLLPCMRAYTALHSGASGMCTQRYVRVCTIPSHGMRQRRHCWEQSGLLGALRRCGKYSGSMRKMRNRAWRENNRLSLELLSIFSNITNFHE